MEKIDTEKLESDLGKEIGKDARFLNAHELATLESAKKINELIDTIRSEIHPNF